MTLFRSKFAWKWTSEFGRGLRLSHLTVIGRQRRQTVRRRLAVGVVELVAAGLPPQPRTIEGQQRGAAYRGASGGSDADHGPATEPCDPARPRGQYKTLGIEVWRAGTG